MQMDEGLDTGDMLAIEECDIAINDTGSSLHDRLMELGSKALMSVLPAIAEQTQVGIKQNDADACYAPKLTKAEAKIDWKKSAEVIQRAIRAYNDWPVAYCYYEKNNTSSTLRIWQAEVISQNISVNESVPGKVIAESVKGIDVATADGLLRVTELQVEGKRKMTVADFLNANSLRNQVLK